MTLYHGLLKLFGQAVNVNFSNQVGQHCRMSLSPADAVQGYLARTAGHGCSQSGILRADVVLQRAGVHVLQMPLDALIS